MAMTAEAFRRLALGLPGAVEQAHMGHPDFRVGGRIFATLGYPDSGWGMVKLTPEQQDAFVQTEPDVFRPVKGGWGVQGATNVNLKTAAPGTLRPALVAAWRNLAPKALVTDASDSEPGGSATAARKSRKKAVRERAPRKSAQRKR